MSKSFGGTVVIRDLEFRCKEGEFVAITGSSGSGKSTFLSVMAGLLSPDRGEVLVDGTSLYDLSLRDRVAFRKRKFGFVFQTFNLIPYLTAIENIQVPLYLIGMDGGTQANVAESLLGLVGLSGKGSRLPSQLSAGEQQRVAIARALANSPRIIFADEPTGNLDRKNGEEVMDYLMRLTGCGVTILLVTHDQRIAGRAQREVKLMEGRVMEWARES
jgi:putative ABC transport system ATP-binding protein